MRMLGFAHLLFFGILGFEVLFIGIYFLVVESEKETYVRERERD